jgi:hypothetical protein
MQLHASHLYFGHCFAFSVGFSQKAHAGGADDLLVPSLMPGAASIPWVIL